MMDGRQFSFGFSTTRIGFPDCLKRHKKLLMGLIAFADIGWRRIVEEVLCPGD
jgi:hypothetical protein